ncbi:hypothetical protein C2E20_6965 [Micractinium conductrix]|uniref:Uncharacterized protein n=1 Tax=Micractinium conductrix TaxID=554055 RepID=A0A2P6V5X8_9CHLO|nr:hypothetical protein C2E20_6965 [Micractinium conductrix]|eukprot:PSC69492.1 hypothetical protein C2E20_6965 [Micractinium conductrix]
MQRALLLLLLAVAASGTYASRSLQGGFLVKPEAEEEPDPKLLAIGKAFKVEVEKLSLAPGNAKHLWWSKPAIVKTTKAVDLFLTTYPPPVWSDGKGFACKCPLIATCLWPKPCVSPCTVEPVCPVKPKACPPKPCLVEPCEAAEPCPTYGPVVPEVPTTTAAAAEPVVTVGAGAATQGFTMGAVEGAGAARGDNATGALASRSLQGGFVKELVVKKVPAPVKVVEVVPKPVVIVKAVPEIEVCEGVVLASCCGLGELEFDAYGKCVTVCKVVVEKTSLAPVAKAHPFIWWKTPVTTVVKVPVEVDLALVSYPPPVWSDGKGFKCVCPVPKPECPFPPPCVAPCKLAPKCPVVKVAPKPCPDAKPCLAEPCPPVEPCPADGAEGDGGAVIPTTTTATAESDVSVSSGAVSDDSGAK